MRKGWDQLDFSKPKHDLVKDVNVIDLFLSVSSTFLKLFWYSLNLISNINIVIFLLHFSPI
jgi:hypothetical protein